MPNIHTPSESIVVSHQFCVAITAAVTTPTSVDTLGFETAQAIFQATPSGTGTTADCKLQESDASGSGFTDVTSGAFTQGTTVGGAKLNVMDISLAKRKRYLRLLFTGAGGSAAGQACGSIILMNPRRAPITQLADVVVTALQ